MKVETFCRHDKAEVASFPSKRPVAKQSKNLSLIRSNLVFPADGTWGAHQVTKFPEEGKIENKTKVDLMH